MVGIAEGVPWWV